MANIAGLWIVSLMYVSFCRSYENPAASHFHGHRLPSQVLKDAHRPISAPAAYRRHDGQSQGRRHVFTQVTDGSNPVFTHPRYPLSSDRHFGRWTTESQSNFTWKSRVKSSGTASSP